jgi:hypothetical protein
MISVTLAEPTLPKALPLGNDWQRKAEDIRR